MIDSKPAFLSLLKVSHYKIKTARQKSDFAAPSSIFDLLNNSDDADFVDG